MSDLHEVQLPDGTVRRLGNVIPTTLKCTWREYGSADDEPIIPRSQWPELIAAYDGWDDPSLPYVHDQNGIGQCNCDATAAAFESERLEKGLPFVKLSAADLYDRINGGSDNGSLLEDALSEMTKRGIGTAETCGTTLWKRGFKAAPDSERSRFRVLEWTLCPTFDHCMSAVLKGRKMISGILWYDNYTPDSDGWLPSPRGRSGGHAIFGYRPAMRNGKYGIKHQNSWGTSWGVGGRFVIPEAAYNGQIGGWWALRSIVDEGGVVPIPQ